MRKTQRAQKSRFDVGYARPPKASQFKPGRSGNPKGRPKGSRTVGAVLQDIIHQKISVTENGKTRRLPVLEVILRRLASDAMRNDQKAVQLLFSLYERYSDSPDAALKIDEMIAEDKAILAAFLPQNTASRQGARTKAKS